MYGTRAGTGTGARTGNSQKYENSEYNPEP
jgi:hypothetical protein